MAKSELIDNHVSVEQSKRAIKALLDHESKQSKKAEETELLGRAEQYIWLVLGIKKMHPGHKLKPRKIPIAHPLVDPRTSSICLITKDPQREYKDLLEAHGVKFISRVVGIEKLKGKFKPYEARRALLKENGMFLADERVIPLLPKLLGSKWFNAKKQPIPVCLTRKDLKGELQRAVSSTYMNQNQGTCTSIKIGTAGQTPAQILENLQKALPVIIQNTYQGWENVQSFNIKTNSSVSLPIWSCSLDDEDRWDGMILDDNEDGAEGDSEEEEEEEEVPAKSAKKSKKRGSADEEEEAPEKARKKVKTSSPVEEDTPAPKKAKTSAASKTASSSKEAASPSVSKKTKKSDDTPKSKQSAAETPSPAVSKKGDKVKALPASVDVVSPSASTSTPSKPTKKAGRAKATEFFEDEAETKPSSASVSSTVSKKASKKSKDATPAAESTVVSPDASKKRKTKKVEVAVAEDSVTMEVVEETEKKGKKSPKKQATTDEPTSAPTISSDDLKSKRAGRAGEKKKEKVVKGKGKSAKDSVLGKKAGQS